MDSQIQPPMLHRMLLNVPRDNLRLVKKTDEMWCFGATRHNPPSPPPLLTINKLIEWSRETRKSKFSVVLRPTGLKKTPTNKLPTIVLSHSVIALVCDDHHTLSYFTVVLLFSLHEPTAARSDCG